MSRTVIYRKAGARSGLGARVADGQPPGASWIILADPEGNEFDLER
jgi:glyoxalase superfamily protein